MRPPSGPHDHHDLSRLASRVETLTGRGEISRLEAEIDGWVAAGHSGSPSAPGWVALWGGMRALLQGRFSAAERLARQATEAGVAAGSDDLVASAGVLLVHLRREEGRPAEAEVLVRDLLGRYPSLLSARVAEASLLGDLGRDSRARATLRRLAVDEFAEVRDDPGWLPAMCQLAELSVLVDRKAEAAVLHRHLSPYAWQLAVEPRGTVCHGSVSLYLGIMAHGLGKWDEAREHLQHALDVHLQVGAPVFAAHTRRHHAALLRARGHDDDWDGAIQMLAEAETIYRRLGIEGRAAEVQALLARSEHGLAAPPEGTNLWRLGSGEWTVRFADRTVRLRDSSGLRDLACLVASPGQSFHVADLWGGTRRGVGRAGTNGSGLGRRPGRLAVPLVSPPEPTLDAQARAECRARLAELDAELTDATQRGDRTLASLASAEREFLLGELTADATEDDPIARVRRLVTLRIRRELERLGDVHPELGRHLRNSVHTGTFCVYEPAVRTSWTS